MIRNTLFLALVLGFSSCEPPATNSKPSSPTPKTQTPNTNSGKQETKPLSQPSSPETRKELPTGAQEVEDYLSNLPIGKDADEDIAKIGLALLKKGGKESFQILFKHREAFGITLVAGALNSLASSQFGEAFAWIQETGEEPSKLQDLAYLVTFGALRSQYLSATKVENIVETILAHPGYVKLLTRAEMVSHLGRGQQLVALGKILDQQSLTQEEKAEVSFGFGMGVAADQKVTLREMRETKFPSNTSELNLIKGYFVGLSKQNLNEALLLLKSESLPPEVRSKVIVRLLPEIEKHDPQAAIYWEEESKKP